MFQDIDDTIERDGFTLRARIEHDSDTGAYLVEVANELTAEALAEAADKVREIAA